MNLDIDFVRSHFPSLGGEWTFMDNAGGSQVLETVAQRIRAYLLTTSVQLGATYDTSRVAGERVAEATSAMATYVNARDPSEVVMGSSTSLLIRILATSLGHDYKPGDEVIVTNCDHEANIGPWVDLQERGIVLKTWKVNPETWQLELDDLRQLLSNKTRLVAVTHASNILGHINPIRAFADLVHEHGALICVDGVAYAPHRLIDVQALDVDFYAFSFYKVYGPHYALLYGKREHLLEMHRFNHYFIGPEETAYKLQPGSVNYELSYGMLGLTDYLVELAGNHGWDGSVKDIRGQLSSAFDRMARHEEGLTTKLLEFLGTKTTVRLIGTPDPNRDFRVPTVSFVVGERKSDSISAEVDKHRIGIRYGDFYARRLIEDLGLDSQNGVVRVSMVHYNTASELDKLIGVLNKII
jgi:cysteine desulfurase family protein (TIGR01976 family)